MPRVAHVRRGGPSVDAAAPEKGGTLLAVNFESIGRTGRAGPIAHTATLFAEQTPIGTVRYIRGCQCGWHDLVWDGDHERRHRHHALQTRAMGRQESR